jgi:hypothetical protein
VCPASGAPLISTDAGGYRLQGGFRKAGIDWPVSQVRAAAGEGGFDVRGGEAGLTTAAVRVGAATVTDIGPVKRYEPLTLSGGIDLAGGVWRGRFDGATPGGVRLGAVDVTHAVATGAGAAVIDARGITFADGGLQPGDLTPLIEGVSTGASGAVDFTGRVDWAQGQEPTSSGRLVTQGLNFTSPAGAVSAVNADVALVSLMPLVSAPDQRITVSRVDALADITDLTTVFTLLEEEIRLSSTEFEVAGGRARFEPLTIPLKANATYTGALILQDVQLGDLVKALNLAESLALDAVVNGRIPFEIGPGRVRFAEGRLTAVRPGRISIKRDALTGVSASPADAPGAPPVEAPVNAIQDFAYQALENLSFDSLDVRVNSLPEGRLGLLFTIKGEHDPAVAEEARVGILDAIRGRAFDRRIPLPKGTPVNLTLDTTLNFDELLQAWLDLARSRAAAADAPKP